MPVSPHGDEYLLRSARAQWERRATVAADAASELKKAFNSLSAPIEANHFGECIEGNQVYEAFLSAISKLAQECLEHATRAEQLSGQCRASGMSFDDADRQGAVGFAT